MEKIQVHAYAKLNLALDVLSAMDNGYHALRMIMQSIALCDDIDIQVMPGDGTITASTNRNFLPCDERNIAVRAVKVFFEKAGIQDRDVKLTLKKRIPVCAGLGGGSSDGAAVLRGLNTLLKTGFSKEELEELGLLLGSDVPFCVAGGTVLAEGRGEILTPVTPIVPCYVVVCKPPFPVSTPELFAKVDSVPLKCRPNIDGMIAALEQDDLVSVSRLIYNVFEDVMSRGKTEILQIKGSLYDAGAIGASMSGTGSAVFGLFTKHEQAEQAYAFLKKQYAETYLTKTIPAISI